MSAPLVLSETVDGSLQQSNSYRSECRVPPCSKSDMQIQYSSLFDRNASQLVLWSPTLESRSVCRCHATVIVSQPSTVHIEEDMKILCGWIYSWTLNFELKTTTPITNSIMNDKFNRTSKMKKNVRFFRTQFYKK